MRRRKTPVLILFFLLFIITSSPAPGISQTNNNIKNPDTFIEATRNSIETLDLHFMLSSATTCIAYNVYDSLLLNRPGQGLVPGLSIQVPSVKNKLVQIQKDGKTFITFPIRNDVLFHNKTPLSAEDVKYTFTRAIIVGAKSNLCKPLTGVGSFQQLIKAKGVEAAYKAIDAAITIKDNRITFHLEKPFSPFLDIIADNGMAYGILNKKWCIQQGAWPGTAKSVMDYVSLTADKNALHDKMMGTGPFKMVSWKKGEQLILDRFDHYWQGPAKLSRVIRQVITDNTVSVQYLQQGDVDFFCLGLPDLQKVEGHKGIVVVKGIPSSQLIKLNFNFDIQGTKYLGNGMMGNDGAPKNFFSDLYVRKGFCYAFDYQTFINDVLLGAGQKPYGPVLIGFPTANPDTPQYSFDLEKASAHLKKAHDGQVWEKGFTIKIPYSAGSTHRQRALDILKANLKQINPKFKLELTSLPWASYVGAIQDREIPISIFGILPKYRHPYAALSYHMGSTDFYATTKGYSNLAQEKYDPLIDAMTKTFDDKKVNALSHKLQRLSHEDALAIFHYQVLGQVAMRDWVKGYQATAFPFLVDYYQIHKQ